MPILKQYPVTRAAFFGSYARGNFTEKSDADILVTFGVESIGLIFYGLREDLAGVLPMDVDLVHRPGVEKMEEGFRINVFRDEDVFYENNRRFI